MNRREFAKFSALAPLLGMSGMIPEIAFAAAEPTSQRILVLVELNGGNDGLNTLIPLRGSASKRYRDARPTLQLKQGIEMGSGIGMNNALEPLKPYWDRDELAWIQTVGYPKPDRSHFRSKDIWETASSSNQHLTDGWLSLVLPEKKKGLHGVVVGSGLGPMAGKNCRAVAMHDPLSFVEQANLVKENDYKTNNPSLAHVIDIQHQLHGAKQLLKKAADQQYLDQFFKHSSDFNNDLKSVAQMIVGGSDAMVYKVTLPDFDTHASQAITHHNLLSYLAKGLDSFSKAMKAAKMWDNVMVMTYSEFGRSVTENLSYGTDHGTAAPLLVMGGKVKGGEFYGDKPDLNHLDSEKDIHFSTDFRSVYATIAQDWWGEKNPWSEQHSPIHFVS